MKLSSLTIVVFSLLLLAFPAPSFAQNEWDAALDRYEEICTKCIELRQMIGRDENVPAEKVSSLLSQMKLLRERLKETSSSMTPGQRERYARIRDSYASHFGVVGEESPRIRKDALALSYPKTLEAVAYIQERGEDLLMPPRVLQQRLNKFHFGILGVCTFASDVQYGLSLSGRINRWGAYVSARSNFLFTDPTYFCSSSGKIEGGGVFWGDESSRHTYTTICAGPTYRACRFLDIYAGIGYVGRKTFWRDLYGKWAGVSDLCYNSIFAEAGARFLIEGFCLSCGAGFDGGAKTFVPQIGLGYEF